MAWGDREQILNIPNESINRNDINPDTLIRRILPGSGILLAGTGVGDETISVDDTKFVPVTRSLIGGTGIAAIGDLSADRTINIDQAAALTWTGVHTHNANINMGAGYTVDGRDVSADGAKLDGIESGATADQIITAGTGLVGGGTGDVTLHVGAGDGIQLAADTVSVDSTVVRTTRTLTAGSYLSGGGSLAADRRFDVTPSTIPHQDLSGAGTNTHAQIDSHIGSTANPHSVTAAQVGKDTAQWNADRLQGRSVSSAAPSDGAALVWDAGASQWEPGTPGELQDESRTAKVEVKEYAALAAGTWMVLANVSGSGNLSYIWLALDPGASGDPAQAWQYPLKITVDGVVEVDTIVGNFFASTFGAPRWGVDHIGCSYMSLESGDGRSSYYRYVDIPYTSSLKVEVKNTQASATLTIWAQVGYYEGVGDYGNRHQAFHAETKTAATVLQYAAFTLIDASPGQGTLEGFMLAVDGNASWSFLEGDIEIWVDGVKTHHYPGTEDAFLGSFYFGGVKFQTPRSGMTKQHTRTDDTPYYQCCFYRFFRDDPIPFENSIKIVWYNGESGQGAAPGDIGGGVYSEVWFYTAS